MTGRGVTGVDVPRFAYTGIAQTFNNSPFNDYPYAMARLRWFVDAFRPVDERLVRLGSILRASEYRNARFAYLQSTDASEIDEILDVIFHEVNGDHRRAREFGPREPGIGQWVHEDEFIERYTAIFPQGADRQAIYELVGRNLKARNSGELTFDDLYLYPPHYGARPGLPVRHSFWIFGHTNVEDQRTAMTHLREAVDSVLGHIGPA